MRIGIIGDYDPGYPSHEATHEALQHSAGKLGLSLDYEWVPTASLSERPSGDRLAYDGYWIAPGSHQSVEGILRAIQYAREHNIPLLGTCGGFQHMLIEFARNRLMLRDLEHEEQAPGAANPFIQRLACSLVGERGEVTLRLDSKVYGIYQRSTIKEPFRCQYGLNPSYLALLEHAGLKIAGTDARGEPRVVELPQNRFYVGTLYVPQLDSTADASHCLIDAFVRHVFEYGQHPNLATDSCQ